MRKIVVLLSKCLFQNLFKATTGERKRKTLNALKTLKKEKKNIEFLIHSYFSNTYSGSQFFDCVQAMEKASLHSSGEPC